MPAMPAFFAAVIVPFLYPSLPLCLPSSQLVPVTFLPLAPAPCPPATPFYPTTTQEVTYPQCLCWMFLAHMPVAIALLPCPFGSFNTPLPPCMPHDPLVVSPIPLPPFYLYVHCPFTCAFTILPCTRALPAFACQHPVSPPLPCRRCA